MWSLVTSQKHVKGWGENAAAVGYGTSGALLVTPTTQLNPKTPTLTQYLNEHHVKCINGWTNNAVQQ